MEIISGLTNWAYKTYESVTGSNSTEEGLKHTVVSEKQAVADREQWIQNLMRDKGLSREVAESQVDALS